MAMIPFAEREMIRPLTSGLSSLDLHTVMTLVYLEQEMEDRCNDQGSKLGMLYNTKQKKNMTIMSHSLLPNTERLDA